MHGQRKALHEKTAQAVEALHRSNLEDHYGELAHHYTKGGNTEKAIEYLHLAGQQAAQHTANDQAIRYLTQALELLNTLADTRERAQQELALQMALGTSHMVTKGYGDPEAGLAYARADALCRRLGDRREAIDVLLGLWVFHLSGKSELTTARELAEQVLRLAQKQNDPTSLAKARVAMSASLCLQGELLAARGHLGQCISLYERDLQPKSLVSTTGIDRGVRGGRGVLAHGYAAMTLWLLGYPARALESGTAAVALAKALAHPQPHISARALIIAAMVHGWRGELQAAREHAQAAVTLSHEQGFTLPCAGGTILHRATLAGLGHGENQVRGASEAVGILRDSGTELWMPYYLAAMAEVHSKADQADAALSVLSEATEMSTRRGERWYEAELYRLKGEMTLQLGGAHPTSAAQREAEAGFEKALDIAKAQSAKSWELRATTSLARFWQQQGKRAEAHELLSDIYNWFTEGFDTKDLQEAKVLLEELG